ncbi:FG-GAP-like repeat-containing protein, partial [Rhodocaloribacter sp.]
MRHSDKHFLFFSLLLCLAALPVHAQEYTFTDVTNTAGVSNDQYHHFGATWADYDKDGWLDLYVVNGAGVPLDGDDANTLYRNNGDGTFTDVTVETGTGDEYVAMRNVWADYDRDGDLDLYSHNFVQSTLYRNDGGIFVDANAESGAGLQMDKGTGAAWGDYDNDGWLDLHATSFPGFNALLHNNGDGTFTDVTFQAGLNFSASAMGNMWGDFDNDGDLDLAAAVVTKDDHTILYRNNGNGTFTDITVQAGLILEPGSSNAPVLWADYDNDGDLDFFISEVDNGSTKTLPNRMYLFRNNGDATFTDVTASAGLDPTGFGDFYDAAFADFDNDGDLDLYVGVQGKPNFLYINDGTGVFTDDAAAHGVDLADTGMGVIWGDYDNDGNIDLYVVQEPPEDVPIANVLFHNEGGSNHWLQVELVGTCSNHDAIGARLTLTNGGSLQMREINGGTGFFSQHSPIQQFGLGTDTVADELRIDWPSGLTTTLTDVAADQRLTIVEDACPPVMVNVIAPPVPIVVNPGGDILEYIVELTNTSETTQTFDFWITIDLPDGNVITRGPVNRAMDAGSSGSFNFTQRVPGSAPAGEYLISAYVGAFPVADHSDGFSFTKLAAPKGPGADPATWNTDLEAFFAPSGDTKEPPEAFALMENYPNPFNPATTITFTTAETGPVRLSVYDLLG